MASITIRPFLRIRPVNRKLRTKAGGAEQFEILQGHAEQTLQVSFAQGRTVSRLRFG